MEKNKEKHRTERNQMSPASIHEKSKKCKRTHNQYAKDEEVSCRRGHEGTPDRKSTRASDSSHAMKKHKKSRRSSSSASGASHSNSSVSSSGSSSSSSSSASSDSSSSNASPENTPPRPASKKDHSKPEKERARSVSNVIQGGTSCKASEQHSSQRSSSNRQKEEDRKQSSKRKSPPRRRSRSRSRSRRRSRSHQRHPRSGREKESHHSSSGQRRREEHERRQEHERRTKAGSSPHRDYHVKKESRRKEEFSRSRDGEESREHGHHRSERETYRDRKREQPENRQESENTFNRRHGRRDRRRTSEDGKQYEWGKSEPQRDMIDKQKGDNNANKDEPDKKKEEPNYGLSGALLEDTNKVNGVILKYAEPPEARKPKRRWRLYPFKGETALPVLHIHRQSCFLVGRDRKVVDLAVDHPSCSKQHAVLQYRLVPFDREDGSQGRRVRPYLLDLDSANGTFLNNKPVEPRKYYELMEKDVIKFGFSTREYVLLHENSKEDQEDDDIPVKEEPAD